MHWLINALAKAGDWANGKKMVIGGITTVVGIVMYFTPAAKSAGEVVAAGVTLLTAGAVHKAQKKKQKENGG